MLDLYVGTCKGFADAGDEMIAQAVGERVS
jgi:hypothetical protein